MYESFYNLKEKPFSLLPDPSFLFLSKQHDFALTALEYGLANRAGIVVVTGEIGAGKTTLIRHLLDRLHKEITVGQISNTHPSFGELLPWVLMAFGLEFRDLQKIELYQTLVEFLTIQHARLRRPVLVIDEAQNLEPEKLEELRVLSNVNADKDLVLQLVLLGQPELRDTLNRPDLAQFAQRVSVNYHLGPLEPEETEAYIRHRLTVAGGVPNLFEPVAIRLVHHFSRGVPRLINTLCETALVYGYAAQKPEIDSELIRSVLKDQSVGGAGAIADVKRYAALDQAQSKLVR